ncbi:Mitochondrial translocator assembly and maintenance protein 41 [Pleurotus pulmonarius]|nr:Mitochondrial translocator assembly and maintenance protein 41 [Pleurotus pulmonarius]KAF4590840.1 Mitochondrial translocator assembly and maintenance protein 41 [Pleurotus pulmonarius]
MLATKRLPFRTVASTTRRFATESVSSSTTDSLPPPSFNNPPKSQPTRLYPRPRSAVPNSQKPLQSLPSTFGRNQLLPVSSSTRALLESIVAQFDAPIRYAFAYGSGVFEQDGYTTKESGEKPMLDFMFAVTHASHWHSINMHQNPSHYPLHARTFGSSYVSRIEELGPGVWFNAYVPMNGVTIKYGVTTVDNLCSDLLNWNSLYLAGRMHKPLRIIKDDARVRLTQQVNLTSAVRAALLTLPASFPENELFERITSISYLGDPRMILPAENRNKVANIVSRQGSQFRELYYRLVVGLPGVRWRVGEGVIEQEDTAKARAAHLRKLPRNLLERLKNKYVGLPEDESTYWVQMAEDERLPQTLMEEISGIVRYPATIQSLKGLVTAGLGKSLRYSAAKISKWRKSS